LLTHSPIVDLKRIVIWNQLDRLQSGVSTPESFDVDYLYLQLAKPGRDAIEQLKLEYADNQGFVERLSNPRPSSIEQGLNSPLQIRPAGLSVSEDLQAFISARQAHRAFFDSVYLIAADLNDDGQNEYLYVHLLDQQISYSEVLLKDDMGNWQAGRVSFSSGSPEHRLFVEHGDIELVEPAFKDLQVGELIFRVEPSMLSHWLEAAPPGPVDTPKPVQ
jgi:hypothetical protein